MPETSLPPTDNIDAAERQKRVLIGGDVMNALTEVFDPEIGMNIVDLDLVREVRVDADSVTVAMVLTTPFCPYAAELMNSVSEKAGEAAGMPAKVQILAERWEPPVGLF